MGLPGDDLPVNDLTSENVLVEKLRVGGPFHRVLLVEALFVETLSSKDLPEEDSSVVESLPRSRRD